MNTLMLALAGPAGIGLILGSVILWDRLREPHRDIHRPVAIGGERDYRDACRRVEKLIAAGDWSHAYVGTTAICVWLRSERHYGSARRRARLVNDLARWSTRLTEYSPSATL